MRSPRTTLLAVCLALGTWSCGGPGDDAGPTEPPPPSAGEVRLGAIGKLDSPSADDRAFVGEALGSKSERERGLAAWALGRIGGETDIPRLERVIVDDDDLHVRMNAARAIGDIGGDRARGILVVLLAHDDQELAAAALDALGAPRYAAACDAVGGVALDLARPSRLRELAVDALIRIGGEPTRPWLERALADYNNGVRSLAAFGLGKLRDPRAVPALAALVGDGSDKVRSNVAQALGMIGDDAARPALEALAEDPENEVRVTAREALDALR